MQRLLGYHSDGTTLANGMLMLGIMRLLIEKDVISWPEATALFEEARTTLRAHKSNIAAAEALRFIEDGLMPTMPKDRI
jgi:hypothetical protein